MGRASAFRLSGLALLLVGILLAPPAGAVAHGQTTPNPVIFVHGGAGSGAQFESQKMRFTSNGYPARLVRVVEYDSTFALNTMADVYAKIDQLIAELQQETALPFLSGVDHFIPAAPGGTGTVSVSLTSRGVGPARTVNFPNRPSTTDQVTVLLNDFECPGRREGCARGVGFASTTRPSRRRTRHGSPSARPTGGRGLGGLLPRDREREPRRDQQHGASPGQTRAGGARGIPAGSPGEPRSRDRVVGVNEISGRGICRCAAGAGAQRAPRASSP